MGLGPRYTTDLGDPSCHDVGELVVLARADHRDEVEVSGDRVDLGDALDRGERFAQLG